MTQDEIIRMAREADIEVAHMNKPMTDTEVKQAWLKCFAALVAAHEREKPTEQEPVGYLCEASFGRGQVFWFNKPADNTPLYAAPVRTKDLTDDELADACGWKLGDPMYEWVVDIGRWAIAADREKNK